MHFLNTNLITVKLPTQIVAGSDRFNFDHMRAPAVEATVLVMIDDQEYKCQVTAQLSLGSGYTIDNTMFDEWRALVDNNDVVERSVSLAAFASSDVINSGKIGISMIDLRVEEGESRFYVHTIDQ
jgi:hypothetical protein